MLQNVYFRVFIFMMDIKKLARFIQMSSTHIFQISFAPQSTIKNERKDCKYKLCINFENFNSRILRIGICNFYESSLIRLLVENVNMTVNNNTWKYKLCYIIYAVSVIEVMLRVPDK